MAEVENVGYKRTKRGEKIQPNELYDEEIAPQEIDKVRIIKGYDDNIDDLNEEIKNLTSEIELLDKKKSDLEAKEDTKKSSINRIDKRIEDKKEKIEEIKLVVSGFEERKAEIENFIAIHYEEDDGKWIIKEEYYDRTDEKLLIPFQSGGLLENEKSPDVLLRKQEEIKLLEIIRKEVSWQ